MTSIIGDRKSTSAYDPGLAERMNRQVEEELRQEELARRLEEARRKREPAEAPRTESPRIEPPSAPIVQAPNLIIQQPEIVPPTLIPPSPATPTPSQLEIIEGDYLTVIHAAVPETIQTAAEIQKARVKSRRKFFGLIRRNRLNNHTFYTANVALYGVEEEKPFLLFGGREAFLKVYVSHIEDVSTQIGPNRFYTLPEADKVWALNEGLRSGALKRFDLAELIETVDDSEYGHFVIAPASANNLQGSRRELAELIHGSGDDYLATMEMLAKNNIKETKVFLLNPNYVSLIAEQDLLGRLSWLNTFSISSAFGTVDYTINAYNCILGNCILGGTY